MELHRASSGIKWCGQQTRVELNLRSLAPTILGEITGCVPYLLSVFLTHQTSDASPMLILTFILCVDGTRETQLLRQAPLADLY